MSNPFEVLATSGHTNYATAIFTKLKTNIDALATSVSAKVSKSGDTMTGTLTTSGHIVVSGDENYIKLSGDGARIILNSVNTATYIQAGEDSHDMTKKNNIHIASWNGVSFGSTVSSATYYNKPAIAMNCRTGDIEMGGTLKCTAINPTDPSTARTNLQIRSGTAVVSFSSGAANVSFAAFGLTARPKCIIITSQSIANPIRYNYDSSSSSIRLEIYNATTSGNVRFCWICIP